MITGGSGYIGMNLIKHLREADCTYINYDSDRGMDILDERMLYQKMKGCDAVIHLAALPDISYCEKNILGTCNVVDAAKRLIIPVIMISTFAVKADNVYGLTKRLAEKAVLRSEYVIEQDGKPTILKLNVVLRLANVYGGIGYLQKKRSAVSSFVKHKKNGVVATIYGDGSNERDFVHVDDVCNAILLAFSAAPGVYEICTKKYTSIKELADLIGVEYEFMPPRPVDVQKIPHESDNDGLGWKPKISLKKGIEEMLK
jgi:UDP-glucose 4-epimerase